MLKIKKMIQLVLVMVTMGCGDVTNDGSSTKDAINTKDKVDDIDEINTGETASTPNIRQLIDSINNTPIEEHLLDTDIEREAIVSSEVRLSCSTEKISDFQDFEYRMYAPALSYTYDIVFTPIDVDSGDEPESLFMEIENFKQFEWFGDEHLPGISITEMNEPNYFYNGFSQSDATYANVPQHIYMGSYSTDRYSGELNWDTCYPTEPDINPACGWSGEVAYYVPEGYMAYRYRKPLHTTCVIRNGSAPEIEDKNEQSILPEQSHYAFRCETDAFRHSFHDGSEWRNNEEISCEFNFYLVPGVVHSDTLFEDDAYTSQFVTQRACDTSTGPIEAPTGSYLLYNNHGSVSLSASEVLATDEPVTFQGWYVSHGFRLDESYTDSSQDLNLVLLNYYEYNEPEVDVYCEYLDMTKAEIEADIRADLGI